MSRTLRVHSAKKEFDAELGMVGQNLHGTKGSFIPEFLLSGSIVLQAVLGIGHGSVEYGAGAT
jgi:hypothetical protein